MEADIVAYLAAVKEAVWLRRFLFYLEMQSDNNRLVTAHYDSQAAITITKDPKYHYRIKYIDTKYNFVRDIIAQKEVVI